MNSVSNVSAHNVGLSDTPGSLEFYYYAEGTGNASLANLSNRVDSVTLECPVDTLDNYVTRTGIKIDLIKCDVEGAELSVFKGAINTIASQKPIIFSEILRKWSKAFGYEPNEIFHLLRLEGYRVFTLSSGQYPSINEFNLMDGNTIQTNFLFLHSVQHKRLISQYISTKEV